MGIRTQPSRDWVSLLWLSFYVLLVLYTTAENVVVEKNGILVFPHVRLTVTVKCSLSLFGSKTFLGRWKQTSIRSRDQTADQRIGSMQVLLAISELTGVPFRSMGDWKAAVSPQSPPNMGDDSWKLCPWSPCVTCGCIYRWRVFSPWRWLLLPSLYVSLASSAWHSLLTSSVSWGSGKNVFKSKEIVTQPNPTY